MYIMEAGHAARNGCDGLALAAHVPSRCQAQEPRRWNWRRSSSRPRKRDESFRDVPVTVNVFTRADIETAGIQTPADFIALVPNMTLVETQNAGNAFVVVRGISQARNSEPRWRCWWTAC